MIVAVFCLFGAGGYCAPTLAAAFARYSIKGNDALQRIPGLGRKPSLAYNLIENVVFAGPDQIALARPSGYNLRNQVWAAKLNLIHCT